MQTCFNLAALWSNINDPLFFLLLCTTLISRSQLLCFAASLPPTTTTTLFLGFVFLQNIPKREELHRHEHLPERQRHRELIYFILSTAGHENRPEVACKLTPRSTLRQCGRTGLECRSISNLISSDEASSSMRRNKELYSSFRDTYFLDYCGSRKVQNRFLWGPLYERVFMNVLLVNWKMFPSRRCCLPSCNLACLVDWQREEKKQT